MEIHKRVALLAQALLIATAMNNARKKIIRFSLAAWLLVALPTALHAYDEVVVKDGATIRGAVKLDGQIPKMTPLQVTKYKDVCKDVPNETLIVGPTRGLRYAVVTLEGIGKGKAVERETVHEFDNVKCRFAPHVLTATVGQFVLFKNSDPILHTAHAFFKNDQPQFNVGLYPGRVSRKPLVAAGIVNIRCEVHPWMSAYIIVVDHPYHAVSDAYGEYEITDVPPGVYQLKVWHETLGTQEKRIEIKSSAAQKVDFTFTPATGVKK